MKINLYQHLAWYWKIFLKSCQYTLLFCIPVLFFLQARGQAGLPKVTLSEKNKSLSEIFNKIKKQTGYTFFYNNKNLKQQPPASIQISNGSVEEVMTRLLAGRPFTFSIVNKTIVITDRLIPLDTPPTKKLKIAIRAMVTDTLNKPISGATVKLKGTNLATLTDALGRFEIKEVEADGIVEITNIGYAPVSIKAIQVPIVIQLHEAISQLDAVQVQAYGKTSQRLTTGSQTTITAAQLAVSPAPNVLEALQGLVPGLTITERGGNASSNFVVTLRGMNSLASVADKGNYAVPYLNSPLILLDGFPLAGTNSDFEGLVSGASSSNLIDNGMSILYTLNPADVESVTVLKDAAATSIYGSRGANGVILINTKRAKGGKLNVTASAYYGLSEPSNKLKLMNTQQYLAMRREGFNNDVQAGLSAPADVNNAPDLISWDPNRNIDWQKVLLGSKANYNAQFNVSGGTGLTTFLAGGSYYNSYAGYNGVPSDVVSQYKETRTTFSMASATQTSNNRFRINTRMAFNNSNSFLPSSDLTSLIYLAPNAPDLFAGNQPNWAGWTTPNGTVNLPSAVSNMVNPTTTTITGMNAGADMSYDIIKQLTLRISASYANTDVDMGLVSSSNASTQPSNRAAYSQYGVLRQSSFNTILSHNWSTEANLGYTKLIGKHRFSVLSGISFLQNYQNSSGIQVAGYVSDLLQRTPNGGTSYTPGVNIVDVSKLASVYGQAGYNYDDKYLVNLSGRRDGSSTFGNNNAWGNFAAVSGAWIFSSESWMKWFTANKIFSFGKIRGSYGTTGNPINSNYQYLANYTTANNFLYEGITGLGLARISNPDMQWSTVTKLDGGLDLAFLNDQLTFSADYYRSRTTNMIVGGATTAVVGSNSVIANFPGVIQNTGFEGSLSYRSATNKAVTWVSSFNIAINRNLLVSFPNLALLVGYSAAYKVGQPISRVLLPTLEGVNPATGRAIQTSAGLTGYSNIPAFSGGFQEQVNYRGFSLSLNFEYARQKGLEGLIVNGATPGSFNANQLSGVFNNRWQKPGDITNIPQFSTIDLSGSAGLYYSSQAFYGDISYIHLSNARLNYSIPPPVLRRLKISNIGLFVTGNNLLYLSKYKGLQPQRMLLSGGLNVTF